MNKTEEFKIEGVIYHEENKYTEEEVSNMFIDFCNSKGLFFGGRISSIMKTDFTLERAIRDSVRLTILLGLSAVIFKCNYLNWFLLLYFIAICLMWVVYFAVNKTPKEPSKKALLRKEYCENQEKEMAKLIESNSEIELKIKQMREERISK